MEEFCGPLAVEMVPGKLWDFSTYLAKRERTQSGACAELQIPDYGTVLWSPGSRNGSRKARNSTISAPNLPSVGELILAHGQRCSLLIMEQCCGPLAVEIIPGNTAISAPILPREREFSLAHAQRFSFLIMEQRSGPLAVEIIPGNTMISGPILPREREVSLPHAQRCGFRLWNSVVISWQ
jgi:hypothetical protein